MNRRSFLIFIPLFFVSFNIFSTKGDNLINHNGWIIKSQDI